jgi:AcrR family transcriptional regulator
MPQQASPRKRGPHQLPAGRHGLSRDFVVQNQHDRLIAAVGEVAGVSTYATLTVEDIIAAAGVSRRTFYDHFRSKDDAFLAAYDEYAGRLAAIVEDELAEADGFVARVTTLLETVLDFYATEPGAAHVCVVEVLAAGPAAVERRSGTVEWFTELVEDAATSLPKRGRPGTLVAEMTVGSVYEVVYARAASDALDELPDLGPELIGTLLLPYVGADEAAAAKKAAKARRRRRR